MFKPQAFAAALQELEADIRALVEPDPTTVPDYGPVAMATLASHIPKLLHRLGALDQSESSSELVDFHLVKAEINALDYFVRILRPFARDPDFYMTIFADSSDTPEHEGMYASTIDLWRFSYPLSEQDADKLDKMIKTIPPLLAQAKVNLKDSQAHDLFAYGARGLREQAESLRAMADASLVMNSLEGRHKVDMSGHGQKLIPALEAAAEASEAFADWVQAEAPKKKGPCGIGKEAYNWAAANVHCLPYDWDAQVALLQRELDRSWSSLALEELRNRSLPPQKPIDDEETHLKVWAERGKKITAFAIDSGFVPDKPWYHTAIPNQALAFSPPDKRDFFRHVTALDAFPLLSHHYHWIELARLKHDPHPNPLRKRAPILNIWQERSEGIATAMEELLLHAGLYDDLPRSKELVWIMLANRAARGLASLYVQANQMTLQQAGEFHARWTPRKYSDPESPLVAFEQLLYARQPGYGASYVLGKLQMDKILAKMAEKAGREGTTFNAASTFRAAVETGELPLSLIELELVGEQAGEVV